MEYYTTSLQHIQAEIERIDLIIKRQVQLTREVQKSNCEFQGLSNSEQEIDALLKLLICLPLWASALSPSFYTKVRIAFDRMAVDIGKCKTESTIQGITLCLNEPARLFHLTPFDVDTILICLAPTLDMRYERLYAYFQDHLTKKRPIGLRR